MFQNFHSLDAPQSRKMNGHKHWFSSWADLIVCGENSMRHFMGTSRWLPNVNSDTSFNSPLLLDAAIFDPWKTVRPMFLFT